ncbi:MAG: hypothetical protein M3N32_06930, partial [Actinomycetota bacterium]|nr:hypothetical protein [Actinomycetota bacterium]
MSEAGRGSPQKGRVASVAPTLLELAVVGTMTLGALVLLRLRTPTWSLTMLPPGVDGHYYAAMAEGAWRLCVRAPFCWRPVVPLLAGLLPFATTQAFMLLNIGLLSLAGVIFYWFLRTDTGSWLWASVGVLLFVSLGWATKFLFLYPWLTDAGLFVVISVAIFAARDHRPVIFAVALAVGVLTKEAAFAAVGLYYGLNAQRAVDGKALRSSLFVSVPAVVLAVAVRFGLPGSASLDEALSLGRHHVEALASWTLWRTITVGTWGIVGSLGALAGLLRHPELAWRLTPFIVAVYAQLVIAHDTERLLVFGFPAVLWLAVVGLRAFVPGALALALAAVTFGSAFLLVLPPFGPLGEATQVAAVVVVGFVLLVRRFVGPQRTVRLVT